MGVVATGNPKEQYFGAGFHVWKLHREDLVHLIRLQFGSQLNHNSSLNIFFYILPVDKNLHQLESMNWCKAQFCKLLQPTSGKYVTSPWQLEKLRLVPYHGCNPPMLVEYPRRAPRFARRARRFAYYQPYPGEGGEMPMPAQERRQIRQFQVSKSAFAAFPFQIWTKSNAYRPESKHAFFDVTHALYRMQK